MNSFLNLDFSIKFRVYIESKQSFNMKYREKKRSQCVNKSTGAWVKPGFPFVELNQRMICRRRKKQVQKSIFS